MLPASTGNPHTDMNMERVPAWVAGEEGMTPTIPLMQMRQQAMVSVSEEDWVGITDPTERRKRQNRINQRLYRRRHQGGSQRDKVPNSKPKTIGNQLPEAKEEDGDDFQADLEDAKLLIKLPQGGSSLELIKQHDPPDYQLPNSPCKFSSSDAQVLIKRFEAWAGHIRRATNPSPNHLPMLIKFNVWRAFVSNTLTLGLSVEQQGDDDALSPFTTNSPPISNPVPPALVPTALQRRIPHHPWVDILPFPQLTAHLSPRSPGTRPNRPPTTHPSPPMG
ncbi:hypothetical protein V494_02798 [Pseudogymnoascus sp. VKM F-4513 (FW-928)]|nr:hypothetical protein V494_02798 [Pseudogymnoascus sp. VKM F-4513 (FW-928)]